jgi:hypothetical protein
MDEFAARTPDQTSDDMITLAKKMASLENKIKYGASCINAIGLFSLINTFVYSGGGKISFVIGLGVTQVIDGLVKIGRVTGSSSSISTFAFIIDLLISIAFIQMGRSAKNKNKNVFLAGLVLYALDSLVFLVFWSWIGLMFHIFFLYGIWAGYRALFEWQKLETETPSNVLIPARELALSTINSGKKELSPSTKKALNFFIVAVIIIAILFIPLTYIIPIFFK